MQGIPDDLLVTPVSAFFFDRSFLWHYRAYATRVIDGDTFVAMVDTGFGGRHEAHIRLLGINTPERGKSGYIDARNKLYSVVIPQYDAGPEREWDLRIISKQKERVVVEEKSFDRFLCDVFLVVAWDQSLRNILELLT